VPTTKIEEIDRVSGIGAIAPRPQDADEVVLEKLIRRIVFDGISR